MLLAPAAAQGPSPTASPQLRQEFETLFAQSIRRPDDLELAFRFAEAASAIGDYEAAIGALERILFYNSGLGRVRLELGVLYFRLGSFAQSRSYFESVLAEPQTPPEVRSRVESFLTELNRRDRTNAFSGYLQAGVRHQSNANAAPNSLNIKIFGLDGLLSPQFRRRPDWNFFMLGGFRHIYDFENQRGDTWETTVQGYYTKQQRFRSLNLLLGEVTSGPRLAVNPDMFPGFTFRPYIIANGLMLGDRAYSATFGVGGSFQWSLPIASSQVEIGAEHRRRQFFASTLYTTADQQDGRLQTLFLNVNGNLASWLKYAGRVYLTHNAAREDFNSFHQRGFDISFPIEFQGPSFGAWRTWTVVPFFGKSWSEYKAANFIVDPVRARRDAETRAGVGLDIPLGEQLSLGAQFVWSETKSNIRNYANRNFTTVVGPAVRF